MTGTAYLKRFCPKPDARYCDTLPVCRYLDESTGDCTYRKVFRNEHTDQGILSGRNWT